MKNDFLKPEELSFINEISNSIPWGEIGLVNVKEYAGIDDLRYLTKAYVEENEYTFYELKWYSKEIEEDISFMDKDEILRMLRFMKNETSLGNNSKYFDFKALNHSQVENRIKRFARREANIKNLTAKEEKELFQNLEKTIFKLPILLTNRNIGDICNLIIEQGRLMPDQLLQFGMRRSPGINGFVLELEFPSDTSKDIVKDKAVELIREFNRAHMELGGSGLKVDIKHSKVESLEPVIL